MTSTRSTSVIPGACEQWAGPSAASSLCALPSLHYPLGAWLLARAAYSHCEVFPACGGSRAPLLVPRRDTPALSLASPSAPTGGSWPLAAMTIRRGCGICPLASSPRRSRCEGVGEGAPHTSFTHTGEGGTCGGRGGLLPTESRGDSVWWLWAEDPAPSPPLIIVQTYPPHP